jgi:hypothetical protein
MKTHFRPRQRARAPTSATISSAHWQATRVPSSTMRPRYVPSLRFALVYQRPTWTNWRETEGRESDQEVRELPDVVAIEGPTVVGVEVAGPGAQRIPVDRP